MEPNDLSQLLPSYRAFTIEELKNGSYEHKEPDYQIYDAVIAKSFKSLNEAFETQCIKFGIPYNTQSKASNTSVSEHKSPKAALPKNNLHQVASAPAAASAPAPASAPAAAQVPEPVSVPALLPAKEAAVLEQTQVPMLQTEHEQGQGMSKVQANSSISDEAILDYDFGYSAHEANQESAEPGRHESLAHNVGIEIAPDTSSDLDEFDLNSLVSLIDDYNQQHHNDLPVYEPEAKAKAKSKVKAESEVEADKEAQLASNITTDSHTELNLPFGEPSLMPDSPFSIESMVDSGAKLKSQYETESKVEPERALVMDQGVELGQGNSQGLSSDLGSDGNASLAHKVSSLLAPLHCEAQFDNEFVNHKRFRITLPNGNVYLLLIYHKKNNIISNIHFNLKSVEDNSLLQSIVELLEQQLLHTTIDNSSTIGCDKAQESTQLPLDSAPGKAQDPKSRTAILSGRSPWSEALLEEDSKALQYGVTIQKYSQVAATNSTDKGAFYTNQSPLLDALPGAAPGTAPGAVPEAESRAVPGAAPCAVSWAEPIAVPGAESRAGSGVQSISNKDQDIDDRVSGILVPLGFKVKFLQDASYQRQYEVKTHSGDNCILMIFYKGNNTISNIRFNKTPQADKVNLAKAAVELNKQLLKTKIW